MQFASSRFPLFIFRASRCLFVPPSLETCNLISLWGQRGAVRTHLASERPTDSGKYCAMSDANEAASASVKWMHFYVHENQYERDARRTSNSQSIRSGRVSELKARDLFMNKFAAINGSLTPSLFRLELIVQHVSACPAIACGSLSFSRLCPCAAVRPGNPATCAETLLNSLP